MLIGWMTLVPSAISSARYLREQWPETKPFGLQIWFHVSLFGSIENGKFSIFENKKFEIILPVTIQNFRWITKKHTNFFFTFII